MSNKWKTSCIFIFWTTFKQIIKNLFQNLPFLCFLVNNFQVQHLTETRTNFEMEFLFHIISTILVL